MSIIVNELFFFLDGEGPRGMSNDLNFHLSANGKCSISFGTAGIDLVSERLFLGSATDWVLLP